MGRRQSRVEGLSQGCLRFDLGWRGSHNRAALHPHRECGCLPTSEETNRKIHEAVDRVERELKQVITYLNDEVVPTVRVESSRALRTAADQLAKLADFMDEAKRQK